VGDGPERANLEALAKHLGVEDRIQFAGFVPDNDLPRHYAAATCYAHTGLEESFGLSVIEAAYCGRPVVTVDEGGVQETVQDGVTGYCVPSTPEAIAKAIEKVLEREDRGKALGAAGHVRVAATYSWSHGMSDIVRLANQVSECRI
jgi:glycosyltransferase involved in cell wall biosynthesis